MKKAAADSDILLHLITWTELQQGFDLRRLQKAAVKIDPPSYAPVCLEQMQTHLIEYRKLLKKLEQAECIFLNSPDAILRLLDKKGNKECLQNHGIPVTQMLSADAENMEQLLELMHYRHCNSVFVKPRYFSGAAGSAAFRIHPARGEMVLYTSCRMEGQQLINTKRLYQIRDREIICHMLERLLSMECVVERWHPKAEVQGKSYDLRAVYQFGHIAHIVVRGSQGPITNLHLNNQALPVQALGFPDQTIVELEDLCRRAVALFPGLSMAGIDILMEKNSLRPKIIEMNGQGDLIYQDIYGENRIYCEQVKALLWAANVAS